jgi:putative flavoprotein involved in K+ transport
MTTNDSMDAIVIGGGQAGLAIGHHLGRQGRRFTILEAAAEPAAAWRARWDSLRLFTPVRHDSLPGLPFPGDPDHYPSRDEVAAYRTEYARHFELPVELGSPVRRLRALDGGGFEAQLDDRTLTADQVVVATGPFQVPVVPALGDALDAGVAQLHSSAYRNPAQLPDGPALVVGGGNTGYQIAEELAADREVHLAIGSRQLPLPQRIAGRDLFRFLEATGLMRRTVTSRLGRRMKDRETLIGSSPRRARRQGIRLHGRATAATGTTVTFADGGLVSPAAVIWATGFRRDHSWIDAPAAFGAGGEVVHERGVTPARGLYLLGMPWQHTRGSALLGWVKDDAAYIAARIADRAAASPARQGALAR